MRSKKGTLLYRSPHLETVWTAGFVTVSALTSEAAGYAARYTMKKINGDRAEEHYGDKTPEFNVCSNGLGKGWIEKYWKDVARNDHVIYKGKECPVPRYYAKWLEKNQPEAYAKMQTKREEFYESVPYESGQRLYNSAKARDIRTSALKRDFEESGPRSGSAVDRQ